MRKNVSEVLGDLLTSIRGAQRDVSVLRDELHQDEAILQLLSLNDKLLKIEASIFGELPKTQETIDKLITPKKRPGRPKVSAATPVKTKVSTKKEEKPAPKKRGRKPKASAAKIVKTPKKPGRRGRATSKNYTENWIVGYSILQMLSSFNGKQSPRLVIYAIDKILHPILTKDDLGESNAAKQRGYDGIWATHLSDSIHRERRTLLEAGLIEKKAPTGVWQISAKGKQALSNPNKLADTYPSFDNNKLPSITKLFTSEEKNIQKYVKEFEKKPGKARGKKAKKATKTPKKVTTAKKRPGRPKGAKNKATTTKSAKPEVKKTTKSKATALKKKPGRPKGAKNKTATPNATKPNAEATPKANAIKKKPGRPKGSKNKAPKFKKVMKLTSIDTPVETPEKPVETKPLMKRPASPKTTKKSKSISKPKTAKPLHKDLAKRKPGRPPKSAPKTKKRSLVSEIEKRMAAKDKGSAPKTDEKK